MKTNYFTSKSRVPRRLLLGLVSLIAANVYVNAQALTGVKNIPGNYSTIAAAVADLNTNGVGAGGVIFNIAAGYTETITAPISITASGTVTDQILFQKSGAGANPLITAYLGTKTPGSAAQDGIWNLVGSDYVTIDGIDLTDPNTSNPGTMEYGYALYKASLANGAQYNTIRNCVITLSIVNNATGSGPSVDGSRGIDVVNATPAAATTALSPTSRAGTNSYNNFFSNTIKNCNVGISIIGYAASSPFIAADTLNNVGGSSPATGNSILNFGGATSATNAAAGVRTLAQYGLNVSYNTVNSNNGTGVNHPNTLRGLYLNSATSASGTCSNNTVTIKGGGTTQTCYAIDVEFGATAASNTVNITDNIVENSTYTTATSGIFYCIYASTSADTLNINNNIVRNNTHNASTGTLYGIAWTSPNNLSIRNNQVYGLSRSGAGTTYGIYSASSSINEIINNNTIYDLSNTSTSSSSLTIIGIYQNTTSGAKQVKNNTIYNFSAPGSTATGNTMTGINFLRGTTVNIDSNLVYGFSGTGATVTGINMPAAIAGTYNAYNNKVYDLSSTIASPLIIGIGASGSSSSTTFNIYNNLIGDLRTPSASATDAIRGINITSTALTSNVNVSYNTIYLNATSLGANFGTTGIYHTVNSTTTTATLNLKNNIIANLSTPAGTGLSVAFRRSGTALANYGTLSNNNLFYAGTPGASNLIFYDGTNSDQTLSAYKTRTANRDLASISENPTWASTAGNTANFLNISTSVATQIESGAAAIGAIAYDFGGNVRQGNSGYPTQINGGGTAPDLGAWEFDGVPASPVISGLGMSPGVQCIASAHTISATIINVSGTLSSVMLNYTINGAVQSPVSMINTSGNIWEAIINATTPGDAKVTWNITATNSLAISTTSPSSSYNDEPLTGTSTTVVASANPTCSGVPMQLTAIVAKAGGTAAVGAGATTSNTYPNPFYSLWSNTHNQYLVTAAELSAAGLLAGNITSLAIEITVTNLALNDLSIKMAHTNVTNMSAFQAPTFTNVFSATTYTPVVGINTLTFATPFNWDGVSNVVIEICHGNSGNSATMNSTAAVDNTAYISTIHTHISSASSGANTCIDLTSNLATYSIRPRFIFGGIANTQLNSYSWSDGLTTVGTTNPLTISPTTNTSYTFTATDINGCSISHTTPYALAVLTSNLSGPYNVGPGQTYTTLTAAIDAYNNVCSLNGPVTFVLTDTLYSTAETFPITINNHRTASATNTLTIQPAAGVSARITGSSASSILSLAGAKYVTINGSNNGTNSRNLTVSNTNSGTTSAVIWMQNSFSGDSATNNTVKNVIVNGNSNTTTLVGIGSGSGAISTASLGNNNNNNTIRNCKISKVQYGIYSAGASAAAKNQGTRIDSNELNAVAPDNIQLRGILVGYENNITIVNNKVGNMLAAGTTIGISLGVTSTNTYTPTGNEVTNAMVEKNMVGPVTSTGATSAFGIAIPAVTSGTNMLVNNSVFSVRSGATPSDFCAGIYIGGGAGSTTKLYFNSVSLSDAATRSTPSAYAIAIGGTDPVVELKNNAFYNVQTTTGAGNSYAIGYASTAFTNLVSDYNLYYTAGANAQFAVTGGIGINTAGTIRANIAALRTATGTDVNSISADPAFASSLNLTPNLNAAVLAAGTAIPGITTDITGATRAATPSIGSYENGADVTGPAINYTALTNDFNTPGFRSMAAFATITDYSGINTTAGTKPRIYYKRKSDANAFGGNSAIDNGWKWTEATNAASPFDFTIDYNIIYGGFVNHQDTIQYFVTAQDNVATPNTGANPSAGFSATSVSSIVSAPTTPNQYIIVNLPPLNGPYFIGASQVSPNYTTISSAISDLQLRGVSGPVTFYLADASYSSSETFPIVLPQFAGASATNTVTIKPDANVTATISGSATGAIIKFANKANRYIIDGSNNGTNSRNLSIVNTSSSTSSAVWFEGLNAAEGVKNSVLKNTIIKGGSNGNALGVLVGGATIGLSSNGSGTDSILIANNNIYNCYYGIVISGSSASSKIRNIEVYKNDIGTDTVGVNNQYYGVYTIFADRINVHHNHIYNLKTTTGLNISAIQIGDNTTNSTYAYNRIHGIYSTSTGGYGAYGINVTPNNSIDNDSIHNNVIYDLITSNYSVSSTTYNAFGIRLEGGSNLKIYYNSVNLYGQPTTGSSASASGALLVLSNTYAGIDIRNNSFTNSMTGSISGSKHYSFWTTLATPIASAIFDYNNFYASGTHGILMNGNGTDITSLPNLKAATNGNANSLSVAPNFTANDNLIPGAGVFTARGVVIPGIQRDFTDTLRNTPPSIGAYEYDNGIDLQAPQISYAPIANSSSTISYVLNGFATITDNFAGVNTTFGSEPRLYYKKKSDANQFLGNSSADNGWKWVQASNTTSPFSFTIDFSNVFGGGVNNLDSISYFVTAQDNATPANVGAAPSAGFAGTSVASITSAPASPGVFVIVTAPPMSGTYTVGTSGNYTSITSAVTDLGLRGANGPVTFELTNVNYSETFPINIVSYNGSSAVNTLTIKPASGVSPTISGSSASSIFRLSGTDYVTIDGSNNGTTSRNMTIENTNTATATAVIWVQTAAGDSATHNKLMNLNITGSGPTATLVGIGFGGSAITNSSAGTSNNANTVQNCAFTKTQYGIYMGGSSASVKDMGNVIINNVMNSLSPDNIGVRGIHVSFQNGIQITGNMVGNIIASGGTVMGISLGDNTTNTYAPTGNEVTNALVNKNIIGPVRTGGANSAFGIVVVPATSGTNVIQNNMISEIQSNATPSDFCAGIYIGGGTGSSTKVYYNTVALSGNATRTSPNCYALAIGGSNPTVDVRNNILFNVQTTTGTGNNYAIGLASTTFSNLTLNYNNYYVAGSNSNLAVSGGIGAAGAGTSYNTLAAFKAATSQDLNSSNDSTRFVSFSDLHLTSTTLGNTAYVGTPLAGITTDIDGNTRNITYPYMGAHESISNPLPVMLIAFSAEANGTDVLVTWTTASESNNKGFIVERSVDGKTFTHIGFVKGAGNSKQAKNYRINDAHAFKLSGSNTLYYRLKQVDLDGNETASKAVLVRNEETNTLAGSIIYPNPFESGVTIEMVAASAGSVAQLTLVDITGRIILSKQAVLSEGTNSVTIDGLAELNKGVYFVHITTNGHTEAHKISKY
jgi:hypothetical protein